MNAPRSGCPLNLTLEALGDRWSLIVIRDLMFGNRRHFRERGCHLRLTLFEPALCRLQRGQASLRRLALRSASHEHAGESAETIGTAAVESHEPEARAA